MSNQTGGELGMGMSSMSLRKDKLAVAVASCRPAQEPGAGGGDEGKSAGKRTERTGILFPLPGSHYGLSLDKRSDLCSGMTWA